MADECLLKLIKNLDLNGVDKFINDGGNVNQIDKYGDTPLMHAIENARNSSSRLQPGGCSVRKNSDEASIGDEIIIRLITGGSDVNLVGQSASMTPLTKALFDRMSYQVVYQLLNHGAHVNKTASCYHSPLTLAIENNYNNQLINELISRGADVNCQDVRMMPPICYSVFHTDRDEVIATLLNAGASVNMLDKNGENALIYNWLHYSHCCDLDRDRCKEKELIDLFINKGLDLKNIDKYGRTLIHNVGCNYLISLCIKRGVSVESKDHEGKTPLIFAAKNSDVRNVKSLILLFNADCNAADDKLQTPLHYGKERGNEEVCKLLLYHGSDLFSVNCNNVTPLDRLSGLSYFQYDNTFYLRLPGCSIVKHFFLYYPEKDLLSYFSEPPCMTNEFVFLDKCKSELNEMKNTFLTDTLTIYEFCILKKNYKSDYIDVGERVGGPKFDYKEIEEKFPIYQDMIIRRIKDNHILKLERYLRRCLENVIIRPLATNAKGNDNLGQVEIIYDCKRIIASYFDHKHLYNLFLASL